MFSDLKKHQPISVFSNKSEFDFHNNVYFTEQDETTITIHHYLLDEYIVIPKSKIVELKRF